MTATPLTYWQNAFGTGPKGVAPSKQVTSERDAEWIHMTVTMVLSFIAGMVGARAGGAYPELCGVLVTSAIAGMVHVASISRRRGGDPVPAKPATVVCGPTILDESSLQLLKITGLQSISWMLWLAVKETKVPYPLLCGVLTVLATVCMSSAGALTVGLAEDAYQTKLREVASKKKD